MPFKNMLQIGINRKENRTKKGLLQKEVTTSDGLYPTNYDKMGKGVREFCVEAQDRISKLIDLTVDQIFNYEGRLLQDVIIKDMSVIERMKLNEQLREEDKKTVFRIIDVILTKPMFKGVFNKNLIAL